MRLFLVRHGESLGNINEQAYRQFGDHNVPLTEWGYRQAAEAGAVIASYLRGLPSEGFQKLHIWYSPFLRTRQSKDALLEVLPENFVGDVREDYLLREQDFGLFTEIYDHAEQKQKFPEEFEKWARLRNNSGKFYARPPDGESRADVAQRVRLFLQTVMREAETGDHNVAIVGHGVTNRAVEMNFLHHSVDWFERSDNPGNSDVTLIEGTRLQGYDTILLHQAADRQPGQEDKLRDAYGADVTMTPKCGG
ncbi:MULTISPECIES: phosphoglycerate mutase family protein [Rhizobium]|uniref:histidine phosphatase family protein n=1 Tax=Rhizobium TaxID=379 RepID=UPI001B32DE49|nr:MULTISPECIES: phosphoglycerate mutase family protein [Rhizobium]MBX4909629.1 phosphoglycerate mutase family protein [Rhizobium bangladeshense]MBX5216745.1 phosphoglycerate mutase family protein [Rhizobium sp. NLR9a]MBX5234879.1 phosphoglycerate mutase family protein [Rhizobium sp. NLR4a]MBX5240557.1 phosphoglycerate mutase family protein [Rhizobium sp. NLR22b]MBX5247233.1 phosphoglycerate mutase family protein [Rhizobium sp. NLR3b]